MITKIHNKYYNLSDFKKKHPGGEKILECCEGIDATAAFESYHVFVNMEKIKRTMKQYQCEEPIQKIKSSDYTFLENGFYCDVKERVKHYLKNKSNKWTFPWLFYFISTLSVYCYSFIYTFTFLFLLENEIIFLVSFLRINFFRFLSSSLIIDIP